MWLWHFSVKNMYCANRNIAYSNIIHRTISLSFLNKKCTQQPQRSLLSQLIYCLHFLLKTLKRYKHSVPHFMRKMLGKVDNITQVCVSRPFFDPWWNLCLDAWCPKLHVVLCVIKHLLKFTTRSHSQNVPS